VKTAQCQIAGSGRTEVLAGDDVIDFKGSVVVILQHPAILAATMRPLPN
jgi:hypothetical protein